MSFKTLAFASSNDSKVRISDGRTLLIQKDGKKGEKSFSFDAAYGPKSLPDLYQSNVIKTVDSLLNGENGSILLLGSENSDKTIVFGNLEDMSEGIVGLASRDIFNKSKSLAISASMIQVSGEDDMLDLFNPHTREMKVEKHKSVGIAVKGLSEFLCATSDDLNKLYQEGSKASTALKLFQSTTIFTISIYKHTSGNNQFNGPLSKLHFFNLCGHDQVPEKAGLKAVLNALSKSKQIKNTNLSLLVQYGFTGCNNTIVIPVVSSNEEVREMLQTVELAKSLNIKPRPQKAADLGTVINTLRVDVNKLREKVSMQSPPKEADLTDMELMIAELNAAKAMDFLKITNLSVQYYEERRSNYSHKGLLWILEGEKSSNHEKIKKLKNKLDQCITDFKEKKKNRDIIKSDLQAEIDSYSKQVQDGTTNDKVTKEKVSKIHTLKQEAKLQDERVKKSKQNMKEAQEMLRKEKDINMDFSSWSFEMMSHRLQEDVDRVKKENKQIIDEEVEKMKTEIDSEKTDLNIRVKSGELSSPSTSEYVSTATKLFTLQAEKNVMTTQLDVLKRENSVMLEHIQKLTDKHKKETEIKQLQNMQTFRAYREVFEEFKVDLENRWRGLLDESIQDAVFLNARNSELSDENKRLKEELHKLKQS